MSTSIAAALTDLLNPARPLEESIDRHFSPDYRQRTDGEWANRTEFAEHIAHLRSVVASVEVKVHEELVGGTTYAERHTVEVTKKDGSKVVQEVYVFGEFAPDGRFLRIEEVTLMLAGAEEDRSLGSAR
jgi:ketosteroid isomerase-like protein